MTTHPLPLTGVERLLKKDDIIVSKTDLKGRITYANRVFMDIACYEEHELIGAPHSIVRHPDMPRCVFKLLWDTIEAKGEIFAYVVNRAKNGDHYWVFAHVTPSFDANGNLTGYHSSRRAPDKNIVQNTIVPLYKTLLEEENRHSNRKDGMNSATNMVLNLLKENNVGYNEFIFSLL
ncbi:MAG: PAS domain-containing protein [Rhodospirillales bacterium]|nr:PAS domain-containing protein [Alphaproteobacteria bacterium]USO04349.1 MAG: PAS domain-containing protein [Rhodospirillales bacterium]